ncbi:MAG: hypothetical protein P4N41_17165 [Negativicutes bacterium]|nr:hypothetical protein [Negativicutes bacterium]
MTVPRIEGFPLVVKVKKSADISMISCLSLVDKGKARYFIMNDNGIHRYFWQGEPVEEIGFAEIQWEFY